MGSNQSDRAAMEDYRNWAKLGANMYGCVRGNKLGHRLTGYRFLLRPLGCERDRWRLFND